MHHDMSCTMLYGHDAHVRFPCWPDGIPNGLTWHKLAYTNSPTSCAAVYISMVTCAADMTFSEGPFHAFLRCQEYNAVHMLSAFIVQRQRPTFQVRYSCFPQLNAQPVFVCCGADNKTLTGAPLPAATTCMNRSPTWKPANEAWILQKATETSPRPQRALCYRGNLAPSCVYDARH